MAWDQRSSSPGNVAEMLHGTKQSLKLSPHPIPAKLLSVGGGGEVAESVQLLRKLPNMSSCAAISYLYVIGL